MTESVRRDLGVWLHTPGALQRGDRRKLARALGVSERALRYWAERAPQRMGRPPHGPAVRWATLMGAGRALTRQGWTIGWRTVAAARPDLPTELLKTFVPALKRRHRGSVARQRAVHRVSLRVHTPGVMAGLDATQVAGTRAAAVITESLQDAATLAHLGGSVGAPSTAQDVIRFLEEVDTSTGLPFVLASDNGVYKAAAVQGFLKARQVIWLPSRVYRAGDNGRTERGIRELKEETGPLEGGPEAMARQLRATAERLNEERQRGSRGYRTAEELTRERAACDPADRPRFYAAATQAIASAVAATASAPQARVAWRRAVSDTVVRFGWATQTRGSAVSGGAQPEEHS